MTISFVSVSDFTPNSGQWTSIGPIASVTRTGNVFVLALLDSPLRLQLSFLSSTCFHVRFDPIAGANYSVETSPAVVTRDLGAVALSLVEDSARALVVDTQAMRVHVDLQPYRIRVYRKGQLISADEPTYNLVYLPGERAIANIKARPENAKYCGFGEKAGARLLKNGCTMTNFNFDNFIYSRAPLSPGGEGGPLNPGEPLYASIPFLIEINSEPTGDYAGAPYCYGLFLDNFSQSYFNTGVDNTSTMDGKYYFGALFGDLDYYFFLGATPVDVVGQYTRLTGRSAMPPKYVFGFHQGCYGY
jgi:alpha-glucosidase